MEPKKLIVEITVDGRNETIVVTDNAGNKTALESVMVVGGAFENKAFYCVTSGSSADLGWALGSAYRFAMTSGRKEEGHLARAFHQMLQWVATFFGWSHGENVDPETLLKRWAEEDKKKAEEEANNVQYIN